MTRRPAGLLIRSGAFALDYLLIAAYLVVIVGLGALLRLLAPSVAATLFGGPLIGELSGFLALTLPISLYFVLHEASPAGATWGKRRLGLRVVDAAGGRLGLGRSALRTALKFVPWELAHSLIWRYAFAGDHPPAYLDIGLAVVWLLIAGTLAAVLLDRQHRSLYDLLAGTRVVARAPV